MAALHGSDSGELVVRAGNGDEAAAEQLLDRHRSRLRQMVALRMHPRVRARLDPSDVVQEALMDAFLKLPAYLRERPLPFYPWLRQIAWERLVEVHRKHLKARKRSIDREAHWFDVTDESAMQLASQFVDNGTNPSGQFVRQELRERVRSALAQLEPADREVLVMRHLEQLQVSEVAAILGITEGAVKMRRLRAVRRLCSLLDDDIGE